MVSLDPDVRDVEVPCVVPSVSLVLVPVVCEVPSVRDRDVPCDTPCDWPLFQLCEYPSDLDWVMLRPSLPPVVAPPHKRPASQLVPHEAAQLLLVPSFTLRDLPVLTELLVPSFSDVPVDDDRPRLSDLDCDELRERLSDCELLSLADRTSRTTSVSPISSETYLREKRSSRLKNTLSPELARKVSQLSL